MKPSIGRVVHYVSYGTPGGEYGKECCAAIITALQGAQDDPEAVSLTVFNPEGMFLNQRVRHEAHQHGEPLVGGTWHWPEMVD